MSMRFKIFQSVPFTDSKGVTYRNHKIFIKNKPYWFSEKEYVNYPELLLINDNYIHIQETQKDLYEIILQSNQIGEFNTIVPISPINSKSANDSPMIHEPVTLGSILRSNKPGLKKLKLNHAKNQKHDDLTQDVIKQSNDLQIDFIGDDLAETDESHISEYNEEEVVKAKSKEKLQEVDHSRRLKIPKNVITALGKSLRNKDAVLSDIDIYHFSGIIEITLTDKTSKVEYVGYPTIEAQQINIEDFFDGDALSTLEKIFGDGVFDENGRLVTNISMINKILPNYSIGLRIPSANELEKIKAGHQLLSQEQKEVNSGQKSLNDLNQDLERTISSVEEIDKIEPDNKSETFKGNKINPTSSFKRKLATFKENNPTDPSNIFPEDFLDINDLFPEEANESIKEPFPGQTTIKDIVGNPKNTQISSLDAKIQFINGLVAMASREKINNRLRERLFNLVSKELDGQKGREDKIFEEINNIKKILLQSQTVPPPTSDTGDLPEYISPNDLYKFLLEYNTDPILKYTCHEIQDESVIDTIVALSHGTKYKYIDHLTLIRNAFKSLSNKHKVNKRIWSLMNNYINGPYEWSSDNISINWSSPEIIEWSFNNPEKVPNPGGPLVHKTKNKGFTFSKPIYSGLTGEKITSFSQLIIHFKHMFHLKGDHSLRTVIEKINNSESFKELIDFKFSETQFWNNLELFTDVDKLTQAYKDILKMILEVSKINKGDKPVVGLEFYEENSRIYFSIHHINSVYQKTLTNTIERIGESQSNLIKTKINGLCDLFLKADFGHDVFALVNLWDGNERSSESILEFNGVQYILKF